MTGDHSIGAEREKENTFENNLSCVESPLKESIFGKIDWKRKQPLKELVLGKSDISEQQKLLRRKTVYDFFKYTTTSYTKLSKAVPMGIKQSCYGIKNQNTQTKNGEICQLPYIEGKMDAIKRILPQTLVELLNGKYTQFYEEMYIIDCRFPYEYKGGHIPTAINANTIQKLEKLFSEKQVASRKAILIFHCEYSSFRAPKMALDVRNRDRLDNILQYPTLSYPEMYILDGGYKAFYEQYKDLCIPKDYVKMTCPTHKENFKQEMAVLKEEWCTSRSITYPTPHLDTMEL